MSKSFFAMPQKRDYCLVSDAVISPAMELYVGNDSLQSIDPKRRRIVQGSKNSTGRRYATMKFCELKMSFVSKISCSSASRAFFSCYLLFFKFIELFPSCSRWFVHYLFMGSLWSRPFLLRDRVMSLIYCFKLIFINRNVKNSIQFNSFESKLLSTKSIHFFH